MKRLGILGSTGSIGTNCLQVVENLSGEFEIEYLAAHSNIDLLYQQTQKFHPKAVAIVELNSKSPPSYQELRGEFKKLGTEVLIGSEGLVELAARDQVDIVVNAVVGAAGLPATLRAIANGSTIALANKETLVTAGELVTQHAHEHGATLIPIDSEHSAIWQCLCGEPRERIQRLILTASGGPFRETPQADFAKIKAEDALKHPNWDMGAKITIDSATMMNKGLEVIEAFWLFELPIEKIEVLIHPQSIIHSMVEFVDGSVKAQLGLPDMRVPIQYALTYPDRRQNDFPRLDFVALKTLTFHSPDFSKFTCMRLAFEALREGGHAPTVLNAANEEAVFAFLKNEIRFDQIPVVIEGALENHDSGKSVNLKNIIAADHWARQFVRQYFRP